MFQINDVSSFDKPTAEAYKKEFIEFIKPDGYIIQQVFNYNEAGLFWKMSHRVYIALEERALLWHSPLKDRLIFLLCGNISTDLKIKPLLVYHS